MLVGERVHKYIKNINIRSYAMEKMPWKKIKQERKIRVQEGGKGARGRL